jgi:hypothetical protein
LTSARPAAGVALFHAVIDAVRAGADAALPGIPVTDTIKRVDGEVVVETLDRSTLVAVQTPQAFRAEALRAAHATGGEATDDGALIERAGGRVVVVPGHAGAMSSLRNLYGLHYRTNGPMATLWDDWLPPATLWPATGGQLKMRERWAHALSTRLIDAEGYVSTHQHDGTGRRVWVHKDKSEAN